MPQNELPALLILDGDMKGQHFLLKSDTNSLGRDDICDMVIPHRQISRQHIVIHRIAPDRFALEDLNSRNGTWVNGNRIEGQTVPLGDGDEIHLALVVRLRFVGSGVTAPATTDLPDVIPSESFAGRLRIDIGSHRLFIDGKELDPALSLPQYRLIELLYVNSNRVCTREEVVDVVWPDAQGVGVSEQAIDALVRRLRDRLSELAPDTQFVETVRGHGFRLNNPVE